ncbi:hypothetical protein GPECTOR_57g522 [Gonium pectorale]|uniref:Uncharacterized protein n=1 Tax=Gonium pectorale TaxID=33097 RepID=A0A150G5V3_GONPE|nr:hypothetical protein GPECTOR_57g522 [Gonium pectorale]|eukprot:KXZ45232.1 hypothetical protein GPECTOR_57g522 [Gonium pectorale]
MDKPPAGYPKVPADDVEAPDTKQRTAPDQQPYPPAPGGGAPQQPAPYPPYPSVPGQTQGGSGGGAYPAGPGTYPAVPPAGVGAGAGGFDGQSPQQPWQPGQQPAVGVPVLGDRASYIYTHPVWGQDEPTRDSRFAVCGWICFVLGFFMPWFWLVAVLLPCCLPGRSVRHAATASCVASIVYAIIAIPNILDN